MNTYEWYLFGHLAGVFLLLAAAGLTTGTGIAMSRVKQANTIVTLLDIQRMSEYIGTSAGAVLVVVFGMLLVNEADYSFGDAWISTAFTLLIIVLAVDHGFLMRQNRKAREVATALGDGPVSDELLTKHINNPATIGVGVALDLMFVVFLWLMIAKPGA